MKHKDTARWTVVAVIALLAGSGLAKAAPDPHGWSLVDAMLLEATDISGQPGAPKICFDPHATICVDGSWHQKYAIRRTIVGERQTGFVFNDVASGQPKTNTRYLLVVRHDGEERRIEWFGLYRSGLCLDNEAIHEYGINAARGRFPCRR